MLLARAQAEIKRLKRRLREALEGTLLGVAEDHDNGGNADEVDSGGCHHPEGGRTGSDETRELSNETNIDAPGGCTGKPGGERTGGREGGAENAGIATTGTNSGGQPYGCVSTGGGKENTVQISAATNPSVEITQKRQTAKLIAENERLREDNDRLRVDVQRLVLQSNKQRLRRQRRQQRSVGRSGNILTGSSPIDWSTRYADAAADARRRRPEPSHLVNSPSRMNRSASSSRVITVPRKRRASPTTAPARVPNLPRFRRRHFGADGDGGEGPESEGEPVEDKLSAEEVQAILGETVETKATETMLALPGNTGEGDEEAAAAEQLELFRRDIREGAVRGFPQPGGGRGNQDEETDIEAFLAKSQRMEDLMFEAEGRERRRLRQERVRLAAAREQRLELEAQLAELIGGASIADGTDSGARIPASITTAKSAVTVDKTHVSRVPADPTTLSTSAEEGRGQPVSSVVRNHQQQQQKQQQPPPPCFDGAVSVPDENRTTMVPSPIPGVAERNKSSNNSHPYNSSGDGEKRIGWAEQPSKSTADTITPVATPSATTTTIPATTGATTAMMMAVLAPPEQSGSHSSSGAPGSETRGRNTGNTSALGARRTVLATNLHPGPRRQQAKRGFPAATPMSHPSSFPSPGSRQRRPATSTGGPPTGSNRARAKSRSRRSQLRAGRVSRSPARGQRSAFLEPASPQYEQNGSGRASSQQRELRQRQGGLRGGGGGGGSTTSPARSAAAPRKALQPTTHPRVTSPSPGKPQRFGRGDRRSPFTGSHWDEQTEAAEQGLAYGVADLGLRLKVMAATTGGFTAVQQDASQELKGSGVCCFVALSDGS